MSLVSYRQTSKGLPSFVAIALKIKKSYEHLNKKMEKFRVCRRYAFHTHNGPINFHENAHIHRFEMLITFSFLKIS